MLKKAQTDPPLPPKKDGSAKAGYREYDVSIIAEALGGGENPGNRKNAYETWCFLDMFISRFPEWQPGITKMLIKPDAS